MRQDGSSSLRIQGGASCPKPTRRASHRAFTRSRNSSKCAARCSGMLGHYREGQSGITAGRLPHRCEVCSETRRGWTLIPLKDRSKAASVGGLYSFFDAFSSREPVSTPGSSLRACFARKRYSRARQKKTAPARGRFAEAVMVCAVGDGTLLQRTGRSTVPGAYLV